MTAADWRRTGAAEGGDIEMVIPHLVVAWELQVTSCQTFRLEVPLRAETSMRCHSDDMPDVPTRFGLD